MTALAALCLMALCAVLLAASLWVDVRRLRLAGTNARALGMLAAQVEALESKLAAPPFVPSYVCALGQDVWPECVAVVRGYR